MFGKSGKLSPRFVGPFEVLDRVSLMAYRLAFPPQLSSVHDDSMSLCCASMNQIHHMSFP